MNRLKGLGILMVITILVITGFQVFWLRQNYNRERKTLETRAGITFRETVYGLEAFKLKLDRVLHDSLILSKIDMKGEDPERFNVPVAPGDKVVRMVNILREKVKDSTKSTSLPKSNVFIEVDESANVTLKRGDTTRGALEWNQPGNRIVKFLSGIDSLQDSLKVKEISLATNRAFEQEKLDVGFRVMRMDSVLSQFPTPDDAVTIGFTHPVSFRLKLENTFPYLLKRLSSPILFSVLLIGFTIFSFVLLYRSLLEQKRLTELKNDFISNITHELNTPIATVTVAIEALRSFGMINNPAKTKEYLDISASELSRLSLLVNKVLKLSLFEKKEVKLDKEDFDLKSLVSEVISIMKLQFEKYDAKVSLQSDGDNFVINADRFHMTSVIYNLLDNALKYSKEKPVIEVLIKSQTSHIDLIIRDNGIGIPSQYAEKIFDKFFRVPQGDVHNIKGYGLGLSYVNNIIRRHHGFITVKSELNKGSSFTVKIPYRENPVIRFDDKRRISKEKDMLWP
jgi:two-component system, OmpR family, phosphate regulon sensor histidine kinase PhoR